MSKLDKSFMKVLLLALRTHTDEGAEVLNYPDAKQFSRQGRLFLFLCCRNFASPHESVHLESYGTGSKLSKRSIQY